MGSTIALGNVVCKTEYVLVVGIVPPQGDLHRDAVFLGIEINRLLYLWRAMEVKISHKGFQPTLIE